MEEQRILGISGRKQSGKNTIANFILGVELCAIEQENGAKLVKGGFLIDELGKLHVTDLAGQDEAGEFDYFRNEDWFRDFLDKEIHPYIKIYSFADVLKDLCINMFGLTREQCYGSDEDKNSYTKVLWENVPGVIRLDKLDTPSATTVEEVEGRLGAYYKKLGNIVYHADGAMTAREVLQYVGTEIFRRMNQDVWAESTIQRIKSENSLTAIITDVRFPNEVDAVKRAGGKVIRLTRNWDNPDAHDSETALDEDKYDWSNFDAIINNKEMSIDESTSAAMMMLHDWGWAPETKKE